MREVRTAIIGCGAIAERKHIPAALRIPEVNLIALVDRDAKRGRALSQRFGIKGYYRDVEEMHDGVELAIVATPNSVHSKISCDFLERGIHVLCEKPMATSVRECHSMISAAESGHAKLMIGHYMRYTSNVVIAKQLLEENAIRNIGRIECSFGNVVEWPWVSNFYNNYEMSGGGILIDYGVHIFDLVCWLTGREAKLLTYKVGDNVMTKIERDVEVELELSGSINCSIRLSRTKKLPNTLQIEGENGWMRLYLDNYQNIELCKSKSNSKTNQEPITIIGEKYDPYKRQLENFIESMIMDKTPPIPGSDGLRTLRLVESCYKLQNKG